MFSLLFLFVALIGVIALSSGLSSMDLRAEWQLYDFDGEEKNASRSTAAEILSRLPKLPEGIWQVLSVAALIFIPLSLLVALVSPDVRKTLLKELKRAIPLAIMLASILYLLNRIQLENLNPGNNNLLKNPPDMPSWITNPTALTAFVIGVVILSLVVLTTYFLWRQSRARSLNQIADEAQLALDQLRAGAEYNNAIIQCYSRMCDVLQEQRRIVRKESMTAREFAQRLEGIGISGWHAQRLTRLFESVRYGAREPYKEDELEAIDCLTAITQVAEKRSRILTTSKA